MKKEYNICIVTNLFPNSVERTKGIFIRQLVDRLADYHHVVAVIAPVPWEPPLFKIFKRTIKKIPFEEELEGIKIYHPRYFIIPKILRSLHGIFYFMTLYPLLKKINRNIKIDLLSVHWLYPDGFAGVICAKLLKVKISLHALGCDINEYTKYRLRKKMIRYALNNSEINIVKSRDLERKIIDLGISKEKVKTYMNGVNKKMFRPKNMEKCRDLLKLPQNKKIILFIGNFQIEKGLEYLIRAFYLLINEEKIENDILLCIVGGGPLEKQIKNLVKELQLEKDVIFRGKVKHIEIPLYHNSCNILCLPSIREGNPNVVIEALSCGKPVVASRVGGVPDIIKSDDYGIMVKAGDIQDLKNGLKRAINKEWNNIDNFKWISWEENAENISKTFKEVIRI